MEEWKPVVGYEGLYEVSNKGRVKTCAGKKTYSERHGERVWKERVLKFKSDKNGYKRVSLYKNKQRKDFLVHRLVAIAFIPNPNNEKLVNHKDGISSNAFVTNLEWCSSLHNVRHAFRTGLMGTNKKVVLIHKETTEEFEFDSMAKASLFLGRNPGYLSAVLKNGNTHSVEYFVRLD